MFTENICKIYFKLEEIMINQTATKVLIIVEWSGLLNKHFPSVKVWQSTTITKWKGEGIK